MPVKLDRGDRRLLMLLAGVALALLVIAAATLPPPVPAPVYPASESPASGGALAAFDWLRASGYTVQRWRLPPADLPAGAHTVLILAEPYLAPAPLSPELAPDRAALRNFLAGGGTILATGPDAMRLLPGDACEGTTPPAVPVRYPPLAVGPGADGSGIALRPECEWNVSDPYLAALFGKGGNAVVVHRLWGPGRVEFWASATPLTNAGITQAGNAALLLGAIGPAPRRVLWDEYFHGESPSWTGYLGFGALPWGLLPFGLLALGAIWSFSRRPTPAVQPAAAARESAFEFIGGIGSLYERARDPGLAVEILHQACARRLGPRFAPPAAAGEARDEAAALAAYRRMAAMLAEITAKEPVA